MFFLICSSAAACTHIAGPEEGIRQSICDPASLPADVRDARTAVHESGHVVAAWVLGCAIVDRVTVVEDDDSYGHTFFLVNVCSPHADAVISLAGIAALEMLYGRNPRNAQGASGDLKMALDDALLQADLNDAPEEARKAEAAHWLRRWKAEAAELISERRCVLVAIADKLREEKEVGGADLIPYLLLLEY